MTKVKFKYKFWLAVVLQIIVLLAVLFYNQMIFLGGKTVLLKLSPPRDPISLFQGHYLRLDYEISEIVETAKEIGPNQYVVGPSQFQAQFETGQTVYVVLEEAGGYHQAQQVLAKKPDSVIFIKGRVLSVYSGRIRIEYGIESYFIPEKNWQEVENRFRNMPSSQDVFVELALSRGGSALIKRLLIGDEEVDVSKIGEPQEASQPTGSGSAVSRARDSRIVSALGQSRTVMTYIYANNDTYDAFTCQDEDMVILCEEMADNGGWAGIAHNKTIDADAACIFSPLNAQTSYWYCVESTGRAGFTHINPDAEQYCWDGSSALCPPFD